MTDVEALSQLLSGDLPREEADALRARIQAEPELAAIWSMLEDLPADLAELSSAETPPADLDARVLAAHTRPAPVAARPTHRRSPWPALALAAGLLLAAGPGLGWALSVDEPVQVTIADGRHRITGDAVEVLAGTTRVEVRGDAWVTVEPGHDPARRSGQEDRMDKSHVLSAAGGAVVTIAVVSGVALLWPDAQADAPVTVAAGETRTIGERSAGDDAGGEVVVDKTPRPAGLTPEVAAFVDQLEQDNARLRFENQLMKGQLAVGSEPIPWPDDLPAALRPERFAESASQAIAGVEGLEFVQEDCAEYPCLVVARVKDGLEPAAAQAALHQLGERLGDLLGGEDARTFLSVAKVSDDEGGEDTLAVAGVAPGGRDDISDGLTERMMQRVQGLEQELGPDAPPE